jgi:hypothetical protein
MFFTDVCFEYKEKQMVMFQKTIYGYNVIFLLLRFLECVNDFIFTPFPL